MGHRLSSPFISFPHFLHFIKSPPCIIYIIHYEKNVNKFSAGKDLEGVNIELIAMDIFDLNSIDELE